jgi:hypothetical protein
MLAGGMVYKEISDKLFIVQKPCASMYTMSITNCMFQTGWRLLINISAGSNLLKIKNAPLWIRGLPIFLYFNRRDLSAFYFKYIDFFFEHQPSLAQDLFQLFLKSVNLLLNSMNIGWVCPSPWLIYFSFLVHSH